MTRKKVLGVEVETDVPENPDTNAPAEFPGGYYADTRPAGPEEGRQEALTRIADSLDGILGELRQIRERLTMASPTPRRQQPE